jgi:uncharacterized repeat protein (TIGR03803 family)
VLSILVLGASLVSQAQNYAFSTLYNFKTNSQGTAPSFPTFLIIDSQGNLYGTTAAGGPNAAGTVFEFSTKKIFTVLHNFDGTDGNLPQSLARDSKGTLYGTTLQQTNYPGTVFKMVEGSAGKYTLTTLYSGEFADPDSVTTDSKGNLFGADVGNRGCLCVFEIPAGGEWEDIYGPGSQPTYPVGNVLVDKSGGVYASIDYEGIGGSGDVSEVLGGTQYYSLPSGAYGSDYLRQDAAGNIYGLAWGDDSYSFGLIFKIDMSTETLSTVYSFPGGADGYDPFGPFSIDSAGNIYGTAEGGTLGNGLVFKVTPQGQESVIYAFPSSGFVGYGIVMDGSGNLYGFASGGKYNGGIIYKLTPRKGSH